MIRSARSMAIVALVAAVLAIVVLTLAAPSLKRLVAVEDLPPAQVEGGLDIGQISKDELETLLSRFADKRGLTLTDTLRLPRRVMMAFQNDTGYLRVNNINDPTCLAYRTFHIDSPERARELGSELKRSIEASLGREVPERIGGCP